MRPRAARQTPDNGRPHGRTRCTRPCRLAAVRILGLSWPSGNWQAFYSNIRPRLSDIGFLERLVIVTLQLEVPPKFARAVLDVLRRNNDAVISAWSQSTVRSFTGVDVRLRISEFCIYGEESARNFHINARLEGPCDAAGR